MSEHTTKNTARAAAGRARLTKATLEKPDTVVMLPNGETFTLRRPQQEQMPVFRKVNPKRFDMRTGKRHGSKQPAEGKSTFSQGPHIPFTKFLLTALLMYQAMGAAKILWQRWQAWRRSRLGLVVPQQDSGHDEDEEVEDITPVVTQSENRLREALLPAMMRSALPRPSSRRTATSQLAATHKARKRHLPSAKQMMGPGQNVKRKQPGKLGRLDKVMQQQVRDLLLAQQQAAQLQLEASRRMLALQAGPNAKAAAPGTQLTNGSAPQLLPVSDQPVRRR